MKDQRKTQGRGTSLPNEMSADVDKRLNTLNPWVPSFSAYWSCVDLNAGRLRIDAAASKTRHRRIPTLHRKAVALLIEAHQKCARLPVSRITQRRYLDRAKGLLRLNEWPQDCMRHTAASFLLALHKDAGKVAFSLGNSASVLMRRYYNLVTDEDAEKFWTI